ncbi:hypothetical protein LIER_13322 [Lithospermum erythrorhizon]|uniref:Uncharacterized protein n=1 Tax=Lithospermum erythrorhizon TaxID=34254 RepID=A0AAV3PVV9_LITER
MRYRYLNSITLVQEFEYTLLTPEAYDRMVCAELPYKNEDPYLYSLVVRHMMHGPCGELNPESVCMKDERCKNHYPKNFSKYTVHGKGTYPVYRRRDDKRQAKVRGNMLKNQWVIPYNPTFLAEFDCHINVEVCCDIKAIKYLYKYIHKGHDKVMFRIASDNQGAEIDEISDYQNAGWVSPVEAAWRLFAFPLYGMYPSFLQLQVHLPNFQTIQFEYDADLNDTMQSERFKRTMLTEFFSFDATKFCRML